MSELFAYADASRTRQTVSKRKKEEKNAPSATWKADMYDHNYSFILQTSAQSRTHAQRVEFRSSAFTCKHQRVVTTRCVEVGFGFIDSVRLRGMMHTFGHASWLNTRKQLSQPELRLDSLGVEFTSDETRISGNILYICRR